MSYSDAIRKTTTTSEVQKNVLAAIDLLFYSAPNLDRQRHAAFCKAMTQVFNTHGIADEFLVDQFISSHFSKLDSFRANNDYSLRLNEIDLIQSDSLMPFLVPLNLALDDFIRLYNQSIEYNDNCSLLRDALFETARCIQHNVARSSLETYSKKFIKSLIKAKDDKSLHMTTFYEHTVTAWEWYLSPNFVHSGQRTNNKVLFFKLMANAILIKSKSILSNYPDEFC